MTGLEQACPVGQDVGSSRQAHEQLGGSHCAALGGGQLQGEGNSVESLAELVKRFVLL